MANKRPLNRRYNHASPLSNHKNGLGDDQSHAQAVHIESLFDGYSLTARERLTAVVNTTSVELFNAVSAES